MCSNNVRRGDYGFSILHSDELQHDIGKPQTMLVRAKVEVSRVLAEAPELAV